MRFVDCTQQERFGIGFISSPNHNDQLFLAAISRHNQVGHLSIISNEANSSEEQVNIGNLRHGSLVWLAFVVIAGDSLTGVVQTKLLAVLSDCFDGTFGKDLLAFQPCNSSNNIIESPEKENKIQTNEGQGND